VTDLLDPATFDDGIPHEVFTDLRSRGLTRVHSASKDLTFWISTGHSQVSELSRRHEELSSEANGTILGVPEDKPALTVLDAPRHLRLRKTVQKPFSARGLVELEGFIRQTARRIVADTVTGEPCDLALDVSGALPTEVIGYLLGVPAEERARVARLSELVSASEDPELWSEVGATHPWDELCSYAFAQAARMRTAPDESITSSLLSSAVDTLSVREFETMFSLLTVAGYLTTRDTIGCALQKLAEHPDQLELLRRTPSLVAPAAQEVLRWATPILYFSRTARVDVEVDGTTIAAGEQVALSYAGANFDPAVFADPFAFDVTRVPNAQVAFGAGGPHVCLGQHLARLEVQILLEELVPVLAAVQLDGPPERLRSHIVNGHKRMPGRLHPAE
jgi:cytochrome P450